MTATLMAPGLRERKKQRTREDLQRVALRLFAERGYDQVTVDDIVALADVSHRTFYRYFTSKEDLVLGDLHEMLDLTTAALATRPHDEPVLESIRVVTMQIAATYEDESAATRERAAIAAATPSLQQRSSERRPHMEAALVPFVAERLGVAVTDLRPRVIAACAVAALNVAADQWMAGGAQGSLLPDVEASLQLLIDGLGSAG